MYMLKKATRGIPVWLRVLTAAMILWVVVAMIGNVFATGETTLDIRIGGINAKADLPVTYSARLDGEEYVYDEDGKLVYDESKLDETEAVKYVSWNYSSQESSGTEETDADRIWCRITSKYTSGCLSPSMDSVKADLVFTNTEEGALILSFDYAYTTTEGNGHFDGLVSGANVSETGSVTVLIPEGESRTISLFSGSKTEGVGEYENEEDAPEFGEVTLDLTNISVSDASEARTAILKPANYGTYKVSYSEDGVETASYVLTNKAITPELIAEYPDATVVDTTVTIEYIPANGLTVESLVSNDNFTFDHWQSGTLNLGSNNPETLILADNSELYAAYLQEGYISAFTVGNQKYYDWNAAAAEAVSTGNPIILNQDGYTFPATLSDAEAAGMTAGSYLTVNETGVKYVIPAGVRFVVPKSEGDFGNFTNVLPAGVTATTPITHFRTLTIPAGVTLQVEGEISVNGDYFCKQPYETVAGGAHGLISLNEGAKINVASGGKIWCYGFIAGAGEVEIASGGHAAELLQITDWGGGSAALGWAMNTDNMYNAFYFSQYYVQNIEARFTVHEGATTEVAVAIVAAGQVATSHAPFIGEGGLFHLKSEGSYITRIYDAAKDRVNYDVYGDMETSGITVGLMQYKLSSDAYVLGINGNISLNVVEGKTTLLNDFMLLPGTQVNVAEGAEVEMAQSATLNHVDMSSGEVVSEERPVRLFIIDDYEWNNKIDTEADPLEQLQQLNNGEANYSYPKKQNTLPYTIANGSGNSDIRGNVTASSATINVDGTATFYGNVFTTNYVGWLYDTMREMLDDPDTRAAMEAKYGAATVAGAENLVNSTYDASKDKLITGSGTIINNPPMDGVDGNLNLLTQTGTTKNQVNVPTSGVLGALNEDGTYSEFGTGTYQSFKDETGNTVWYKNEITYSFVVINPATQQPVGTLNSISRKTGVDYDVLTPEDLTVGGQRYAIFGFETNTIKKHDASTGKMEMQGIPIGFIPADGEIVKDGNFNLNGDSQNRNFKTPENWNTLMRNPEALMTYLMSDGITSGWDTLGFVFADLTVMANQTWEISDMLCGGLSGKITVYVVPYEHFVAWENETTGERSQNYLFSGMTDAEYTMNAEAVITPTVTNPVTGDVLDFALGQTVDEDAHTTTVRAAGVDKDLLVNMTAVYSKVNITWIYADASNSSNVYYTKEEIAHPVNDPAVSPEIVNDSHRYFLLAENANVGVSGEDSYRFVEGELPVSLGVIDKPVTVTILVDPYDYKLSFTTDQEDTSIADIYVKDGENAAIRVNDIIAQTEGAKYCYLNAVVTGTATAVVSADNAEVSITGIGSDCTIDISLKEYDYLVRYMWAGNVEKYDFVSEGATSTYEYPENTYDTSYTNSLNNGSQPNGLVYSIPTEEHVATVSVENVTADRIVNLNPMAFDRSLIISDETGAIKKLVYGNGTDAGDNYRYSDNQFVKNLVNSAGAVIEDHLDYRYAYIRTNGTGFFPVTVQIGTYYHVVEFRYFQPDETINGTQLTDVDNVALSTRIFVEEEDGTVGIDVNDFITAYTAGGKTVPMYEAAGEKVYLYMANYSETGDGHANTYETAADSKQVTASNIGKNAFVNVIVVPYDKQIVVTDTTLGTTKYIYADANNKVLTYKAAGTADVTYVAGDNRVITGIEGLVNAVVEPTGGNTIENIDRGVIGIRFTGITGDVSVSVTTRSYTHNLNITYVTPWAEIIEETHYVGDDQFVRALPGYNMVSANATSGTAVIEENSLKVSGMIDRDVSVTVDVKEDVERLTSLDIDNRTGSSTKLATVEITDAAYGEFTVECSKACVIILQYKENPEDTDFTYVRIPYLESVNENKYLFSLTKDQVESLQAQDDAKIVIAIKGDVNIDGKLNTQDAVAIGKAILRPSSGLYVPLNGISKIVGDLYQDNKLNTQDAIAIGKAILRPNSGLYTALEW